jgi:adenine/guanine phosphoribosyltransferase-like PRPP-binding protein
MAKSRKPYPGLGPYVVVTLEAPGVWVAYAGANTLDGARKRAREMSHYPADKIKIVENHDPQKGAS